MKILGISAFYHDSAAALVVDGEIVAAAQEERFSRKKHDSRFPVHAVKYCLSEAGIQVGDLDHVVFYDKPFLKFERLLETYLAFAPAGLRSFAMALPMWVREKGFQREMLGKDMNKIGAFDPSRLLFTEHHQSHAASAFFPSPFNEAVVLTMDGVGEWATTSAATGKGNKLDMIREIHFPHSLGLLYSAFTYYTGFKVNSGEYKLMGLAPYGEPKYSKIILDNLIDVKADGSFRLDMQYFNYATGLTMTNGKFDALFGEPVRKSEKLLTQFHMDIAASIQNVLEQVVLKMTRSLAAETGMKNLCMAGGVALNCVANGKILHDRHFENIWIQPASGDAGGALGAALAAYYIFKNQPRTANAGESMHGAYLGPEFTQADIEQRLSPCTMDRMKGSYLGPSFSQEEIEARLTAAGAHFETCSSDAEMIDRCVAALLEEKALGWFQRRMEFGPRALGARSILGDPRSPRMQAVLNLKVKYRESFRPFAPSVLREDVAEWFQLDADSPYMLLVADVADNRKIPMTAEQQKLFGIAKLNIPRSDIPAVTHVDYSARVQTVHRETNPLYHSLLTCFKQRTGCPVMVNTSFNVRGEPIVCTPEDAFRCFMGTDIEVLAVGRCFLRKEAQNSQLKRNYKDAFELD